MSFYRSRRPVWAHIRRPVQEGRACPRASPACITHRGCQQCGTSARLGKQTRFLPLCWVFGMKPTSRWENGGRSVMNAASWRSFHARWSRTLFQKRCSDRPRVWFTCNQQCLAHQNHLTTPPPFSRPQGQAGIEQLLLKYVTLT